MAMNLQLSDLLGQRRYLHLASAIFLLTLLWATVSALGPLLANPASNAMVRMDLVIALLAVGAITLIMFRSQAKPVSTRRAILVGGLIGLWYAMLVWGVELMAPTHVGWLFIDADSATHFLGWHVFRTQPWSWPPGFHRGLAYPGGTSLLYTDSLPLLAIPLKLIESALPDRFQYVGGWIALSMVVQSAFAALLMREFSARILPIVIAAVLIVSIPALLERVAHFSLTAHWLILAGLLISLRAQRLNAPLPVAPALMFAFIAALVHPYLAVMFLAILLGACGSIWINATHASQRRAAWQVAIGAPLLVLLGWYLIGAFAIGGTLGFAVQGYGLARMDVLSMIDPAYSSKLLGPLQIWDPQEREGAAYLGLGSIALIVLALGCLIRKPPNRETWRWVAPLLLVAVGGYAFAASTSLSIGNWQLSNTVLGHAPFATFRASGRFVWLPLYIALVLALGMVVRRLPESKAAMMLALLLSLQIYELSGLQRVADARRLAAMTNPAPAPMVDAAWGEWVRHGTHIELVPDLSCGAQASNYAPFALLAGDRGATLNTGYFARWDAVEMTKRCLSETARVARGEFEHGSIYVVNNALYAQIPDAIKHAHCALRDGLNVCRRAGTP